MCKKISLKAEVDTDAKIGRNVTIDSFTKIEKDVEIGENTWIGSGVIIYDGARIGKNCKIFPGVVIAAIPQDLKYNGEKTTVEIGDNTTIREYATINKGTFAKNVTKIGNNCLFMAYSHVAHDCIIGNNCIISNSVQVGGEVEIDDWASIGGMTAIHQFCKVGKHAFVSGMSGILSDVPPYVKVAGIPVQYHGINYVGLKRRDFTKVQIDNIHSIYRIIYQNGLNTSQAIEHIESEIDDSDEKKEIISFIKSSSRGIIKSVQEVLNTW